MDIGSLLLILALATLVAVFLARPFVEQASRPVERAEQGLSALLAERERVISALQELDFDHLLGKIPDEDYPAQRASLLEHGANVLRQLDALQAADKMSPPVEALPAEEHLEAALIARRLEADDPLEAQIAARRRAHAAKFGGFCPACGKPLQHSDRFCPRCGRALTPPVAQNQ